MFQPGNYSTTRSGWLLKNDILPQNQNKSLFLIIEVFFPLIIYIFACFCGA